MTLLETGLAKEKKTLRFRFSHSFIHCRHVSSQSSRFYMCIWIEFVGFQFEVTNVGFFFCVCTA